MKNNLPLPPYGKVLLAFQQEGIILDFPIYIMVGKDAKRIAYNHIRMGMRCTYLPYGDQPERYFWPIAGSHVVISDCGFVSGLAIKKMCHHLLCVYAPQDIWLQSDHSPLEYFKGQANG